MFIYNTKYYVNREASYLNAFLEYRKQSFIHIYCYDIALNFKEYIFFTYMLGVGGYDIPP